MTELQFLFISALGYALALIVGLILVIAQRRTLHDLTALVEQIRADKQLLDVLEQQYQTSNRQTQAVIDALGAVTTLAARLSDGTPADPLADSVAAFVNSIRDGLPNG